MTIEKKVETLVRWCESNSRVAQKLKANLKWAMKESDINKINDITYMINLMCDRIFGSQNT